MQEEKREMYDYPPELLAEFEEEDLRLLQEVREKGFENSQLGREWAAIKIDEDEDIPRSIKKKMNRRLIVELGWVKPAFPEEFTFMDKIRCKIMVIFGARRRMEKRFSQKT